MKVVAFVGSPRRGGNTDILVDEVLRGARDSGAEVEKIFLNSLKIRPCQAECSDYCKRTGECKIHDGMSPLYHKLFESDVIVLGTPVYWYGPTAQLKAFIDRWYAFSHPQHLHKMKGKKAVLVAPFEESNTSVADPLVNMTAKSLDYLNVELTAKILVTAGEKGEVKKNLKALTQAYQAGSKLK